MKRLLENCNDIVSIIVPVYKAERYIKRCLDSISDQTYSNIEIIVIDDGSPDNSLQICKECAQKDDRIKIIHQENHGVSRARNVGLDNMSGSGFVAFIDADDYIASTYIEYLLFMLKTTNSALGEVGFISQGKFSSFEVKENVKLIRNYQFHVRYTTYTVWGMLIDKKLITYDTRFDETISYNEDYLFKFKVISHDTRNHYAYSNKKLYFHEMENENSLCKNIPDLPWMCFYLFNELERITIQFPKQIYILAYPLLSMQRFLHKQNDSTSIKYKEAKGKAKKYMRKVLFSMAPIKTKIRYILAYYFNVFI